MMELFRKKIDLELKRKGWSKMDLAKKANINPTLLYNILNGNRRFNEDR